MSNIWHMNADERDILKLIDAAARSDAAAGMIGPIVERVAETMSRNPHEIEAWEPIPLEVYRGLLPAAIRSSWVFILRGGVTTGAERHPNSHQRMTSWKGEGDFQVHDGHSWQSHLMVSDRGAPLEDRWISIPPNVWHQGVVPAKDWVVVSFHTVPAAELVEERPDAIDPLNTHQRRYLDVRQK
jgi:hypothetical protein